MSKTPTIARKVVKSLRLTPETCEHIASLADRMKLSEAETVQLAVNRLDERALSLRTEVIQGARECIKEADEKLEMLERGHV